MVSQTRTITPFAVPHVHADPPPLLFASVRLITQPTRATLTRISDLPSFTAFNTLDPNPVAADPFTSDYSREAFAVREAIGGTRVGSSSWGLASVVLGMELIPDGRSAPVDAATMAMIVEEEEAREKAAADEVEKRGESVQA